MFNHRIKIKSMKIGFLRNGVSSVLEDLKMAVYGDMCVAAKPEWPDLKRKWRRYWKIRKQWKKQIFQTKFSNFIFKKCSPKDNSFHFRPVFLRFWDIAPITFLDQFAPNYYWIFYMVLFFLLNRKRWIEYIMEKNGI